ncbi:hypothetical protein ACW0JT_12815 [Arthrobacter sp. SA17]
MFVPDATLSLSDSLILGWYTGNGTDDLIARVVNLIKAVAKQRQVRRIVLFGFSGGGFAALAAARLIPGSTALVFSPQTAIDAYYPSVVADFVESVFPQCATIDGVRIEFEDRVSLLARYRDPQEQTNFLYIQNTGDHHHLRRHYTPFHELTAGRPGAHFRLVHESDSHTVPNRDHVIAALDECAAVATSHVHA